VVSALWVVEYRSSPLLWPMAYTTACTFVQAVISMLFCINLPNIIYIGPPRWCQCLQKVKIYQQTKFRRHISIRGWDITTSGLEKQTFAILEFYFRFRSLPFFRNLRHILHQATKFCPNRNTHCGNMTSYPFLKRSILLLVSYLLMSLPSEGSDINKSANQILSTYVNSRLRYNYFRFGKTNVLHFGILLPVSISTISP